MPDPAQDAFPDACRDVLEVPEVLRWIARFAASAAGRRRVEALAPAPSRAELATRRALGMEASAVLAEDDPPALGGGDVAEILSACRRRVLEAGELLAISGTLATWIGLQVWAQRQANAPALAAAIGRIPDFGELAELLQRTVDPGGAVRDEADPALATVRGRIRDLVRRRSTELDRAAERWQRSGLLRQRRPIQRGNRLMLAVKATHAGRAKGVVHDRSKTGDTVYVEPAAVLEVANRLASEESRERQIVHRVLSEVTRVVAEHHADLEQADRIRGEVDAAFAAAAWARALQGVWPEMPAESLRLRQARHPLLLQQMGREAVAPLDLDLGGEYDLLVVTGPNTGGKTVVLKTAGLLAWLACCGLPVSADAGTRMPALPGIDADIGDQQSLQSSLSTFSGHLQRILRILGCARRGSLVLLDELGTGTDPEEGAALGQAVLETLVERGALVVANTHLGSLKLFSVRQPRAENASMEFDPETLAASYRLLVGVPGASHALEVAERLGLPGEVLTRAAALTRGGDRAESLLAEVSQVRREAELIRERARDQELETRERREQLEVDAQAAAFTRELREKEAQQGFVDLQAAVERRLAGAEEALRGRLGAAEGRSLEELLQGIRRILRESDLGARWEGFLRSLKKGDVVYVPRYRERLRVTRVDGKRRRIKVRHGQLEIEVPFSEISWVAPPPGGSD